MSWQAGVFSVLAVTLVVGGVWFERSRPNARIIAAVAALAALGVAARVLLAPLPNVVGTTDVALLAGYALGGPAGFAVGALSALVSNFWLGQGPWTPWQMAGWGMVGVGGAALARLTGRSLGRMGLAAAAAVAGLLFGALLDLSAMVNFGGEQSLDRYLALSARGIPFNIAHALGNAAIMLAAGPALVRMLDRYRERFEIEWREAPARGVAAACLAVVALAPLLAPGLDPADAAESADQAEASATDARGWLVGAQNKDGGYGISPGASSNPGMTGWAVLGLEAAGRNPRDVRSGGKSPIDFLRKNAGDLSSTGDLERTILGLRGAGLSATGFGGRNLLAELQGRESSSGSYEKQVNLTSFAILARSSAGEGNGSLRKMAGWLKGAQNKDGGWGSVKKASSEPDSTGAVLQALAVTGGSRTIADGARWLRRAQHRDGGWSLTEGGDSNSQSTAWALQGLVAAGADPSKVRNGSRNGFDYLQARRRGDGHYSYSKASDQTPVWVTAQALTALEREPFPIAAVPRQSGGEGKGDGSGSGTGGGSGAGGSGGGFGSGSGSGGSGGGGPDKAGGGGSESGGGAAGDARTALEKQPPPVADALEAETVAAASEIAPDEDADSLLLILLVANATAAVGLAGWLYYRYRFGYG